MTVSEKHYVQFYSPGTLFSESSMRPVEEMSIPVACEMANAILERHNAKPYGFCFVTRLEAPPVSDGRGGTLNVEPKEIARSGIHYLGGRLIRYDEVPDDNEHSILRGNMRCNDQPIVIENCNSWRFTGEFKERDCIVDADGSIVIAGDAPELAGYRAKKLVEFAEERERIVAEWAKKRPASAGL